MYTELCKQRVLDELGRFFQVSAGDHVTQYNINGLAFAIGNIFDQHVEKKDGEKGADSKE